MLNYHNFKLSIKSSSIRSAIDAFAEKYNVSVESFLAWKNRILELVGKRITVLLSKKVPSATKPILQDEEVQNALSELHKKFVINPIDKASNNVALICKRVYIQKLLDEVGIPGYNSSTYKLSSRDTNQIIQNNAEYCKKLKISLEERVKYLPFKYLIPKCIIIHLDLAL